MHAPWLTAFALMSSILAALPGCDTRPSRLSSSAGQILGKAVQGTSGADRIASGTSGADRIASGTSGADDQMLGKEGTPERPDDLLVASRGAAHRVLSHHCAGCHESMSPDARPEAVAVFDLDSPDWYRNFTAARFESSRRRLEEKADDAEKRVFTKFAAAELARGGDGHER